MCHVCGSESLWVKGAVWAQITEGSLWVKGCTQITEVALAHVREGVSQGQCGWEEGGHKGCVGEWRSLKGDVVRTYS